MCGGSGLDAGLVVCFGVYSLLNRSHGSLSSFGISYKVLFVAHLLSFGMQL
jgi:hypothetical protein